MSKHNPLIGIITFVVLVADGMFGGFLATSGSTVLLIVHVLLAVVAIGLIILHLAWNKVSVVDAGRAVFGHAEHGVSRFRGAIICLLAIVWLLALVAGVLVAVYDRTGVSGLAFTVAAHRGLVSLGLVLAIIHLVQHAKAIGHYFGHQPDTQSQH